VPFLYTGIISTYFCERNPLVTHDALLSAVTLYSIFKAVVEISRT